GLMGGADQHEAAVARCIVHPKRNAASEGGAGEVMVEDRTGLLAPAGAWVLEVAHQLLLLGVHAQHGPTAAAKAPALPLHELELGVALRFVGPRQPLAV